MVTTYLVANSARAGRERLDCRDVRAKELLSGVHFAVHDQLAALRLGLESSSAAAVSSYAELAGGGMTPVAQSILAAAFPPAKHNQGFAYTASPSSRTDRGSNARRMAERQPFLALVLSSRKRG